MYIIAGLGNPGLKYRHTRHNAGFDTIDLMAKKYGIDMKKKEKNAVVGKGMINGEQVLLVNPQTYMNASGESLRPLCDFYQVDPEEGLIVISDDVTLDAGRIRIRRKGSAGGHNGLKSIIAHCKTEKFLRVRVGVGKLPENGDMIKHVLGKLPKSERAEEEKAFEDAAGAIEYLVQGDVDGAMNRFN